MFFWPSYPIPRARGMRRELPLSVSSWFIYSFRLPPQGALPARRGWILPRGTARLLACFVMADILSYFLSLHNGLPPHILHVQTSLSRAFKLLRGNGYSKRRGKILKKEIPPLIIRVHFPKSTRNSTTHSIKLSSITR